MIALSIVLFLLLGCSVATNVLLVRKLFRFEDVFHEIYSFVAEIHGFTSKFEGKALLSEAPEAVHFHKLICSTRDFFRQFEKQEDADG